MEKLSMAENTSDISTESDLDIAKLKRRKHARKILSNDEEESSGNNDEVFTKTYLPLPMPPQVRYGTKKNSASTSASSIKQTYDRQRSTAYVRETQKTAGEKNEPLEKFVGNISGSQTSTTEKMVLYDLNINNDQRSSESESEIISHIMKPIQQKRQENIDVSSHLYARSKQDTVFEKHCNSCKGKQIKLFVNDTFLCYSCCSNAEPSTGHNTIFS